MVSEKARSQREQMTPQEVKLWVKLRQLRELGFHFRRQSPISAYIVDFECRQKLIVEVDGGQHGFHTNMAADVERDRTLENAGYRILRFFWNNQIDREVEGVIETILAGLANGAPPGSPRSPPSPRGEGE